MNNTPVVTKRDRMIAIVQICRMNSYHAHEIIKILEDEYSFVNSTSSIYSAIDFLVTEKVIGKTGDRKWSKYKTIIEGEFEPDKYPDLFIRLPKKVRTGPKRDSVQAMRDKKELEYVPLFNPPRTPLINKLFGLTA